MTEVVALFVGAFVGVLVMAVLSAGASDDAYACGAADEREKLWRAVRLLVS